jgi:hypothetical protein
MMLEQLMFHNKDFNKLVLFIMGKGKKIGTECKNSVIVSYSINPTMFDRISKPGPSGHQTTNHKAIFSSEKSGYQMDTSHYGIRMFSYNPDLLICNKEK